MPEPTPESFEPPQQPKIPENENIQPKQQNARNESEQEDSSKILATTLNKIHQALKVKNIGGELPLSVHVGRKTVFKAIGGQESTVNKITPEQITVLQKALQEPQGIKGAVRIQVGDEILFHIKDGKLEVDKLGLAPLEQSRTQQSLQQPTQTQASQAPQPQSSQVAPASLQEQISQLQATVQQQQQQINALTQKVERFANSPVVVANEKLNNWLGNLRNKVKTSGQEVVAGLSNQLQQNRAKLASQVQQMFTNTRESVVDSVHATRDRFQAKASEVVLGAMTSATAKLASSIGEKLPDGSVVIENRNLNQRLEVNGSSVALKQRSQVDAQALWDKYSQDVPAERPIIRSQVVAQKALNDGMTKTAVEDMLSADPKFKQVQQEQGLGKAQEYAKQMTRSASRQEQRTSQLGQQRQRDQNNLQR